MSYLDNNEKSENDTALVVIGLIIFGVLLQMLVGWNPISSLIGIIAPTIFFFIPRLLLNGFKWLIFQFFSEEAKLSREKRKEINRLKSQERALERERKKITQRQAELKRRSAIERQQQKEREERIKIFLKDYPIIVKLVKGYCSFCIFSFSFLKKLLIGYVILFIGFVVIPLMIDGIFLDQQYQEVIETPLRIIMNSKFFDKLVLIYYVLLGLTFSNIPLFFYGNSKVKIWERVEKQV